MVPTVADIAGLVTHLVIHQSNRMVPGLGQGVGRCICGIC